MTPADSQHALAISIARAIRTELPATDSEEAIRASVEETLRAEAAHNELLLAYLRCALAATVVVAAILAYLRPEWLPGSLDWRYASIALTLWIAAVVALTLALRRGFHRPWLRRTIPLADGASILAIFLAGNAAISGSPGAAAVGPAIAAAAAAALVALSGALRLTRSAVRLSTAAGTATWLAVAALAAIPPVVAALTMLLIIASGIIAGRITRVIRRVITEEVSRIRLVHLYRQAQEAIRAREVVIGMVAHDLRNPLNAIGLFSQMLLAREHDDATRTRYIGRIRRHGESMTRLVNDLLDTARIEAGRLPVNPRPTSVAALLDAAHELMEPIATDHQLTLSTRAAPDLPDVHADPDRVGQIFSNLIGNAAKFTPSGGTVEITARRQGDAVRFGVRDDGPGIPADQLSRVFGHMWQARDGDSRGIGLGLVIARSIAEAHGDQIRVESTEGMGTEFWFQLPLAAPTPTST